MRYKPVPEPTELSTVEAIQRAVPLVPGSTADCCARIIDRTQVPSRDDARRWLTFLTALTLTEETTDGYVRTDRDPADPMVAHAFLENVYAAEEVCDVVATDGPVSAASVTDRVDAMPRWEHDRSPTPDRDWQTHIEALLEWAVTFEVLERTGDDYRWVGLPEDVGQSG